MPYGPVIRTSALEVAEPVRRYAAHGLAVAIGRDALHRDREVVVPRALAVTRARDRVEPHVVGPAARVGAGRQDADRLPFEHRERRALEVEHDVTNVALGVLVGEPVVADHGRDRRFFCGVEAHVGVRGRPRRRHGPRGACGLGHDARDVVGEARVAHAGRVGRGRVVRERLPPELLGDGVRRLDTAVAVDGARGAGRDAVVAAVARVERDRVLPRVVGNRLGFAHLLARVAANAHVRVDEVLALQERRGGGVQGHLSVS